MYKKVKFHWLSHFCFRIRMEAFSFSNVPWWSCRSSCLQCRHWSPATSKKWNQHISSLSGATSQACFSEPPLSSPRWAGQAAQPLPADDVADDVGVAHEDLVAVLLLLGISSMDEVSKSSLNASSIFVILLEAPRAQLHTAPHSSQQHLPLPACLISSGDLGYWGAELMLLILTVLHTYWGGGGKNAII